MNKNPEIQFRSPEEIKAYQESRLAEELLYLQNHSRFYQRLFQAHHIDIQQIKTIEDLQQIPVTTKTDLQLHNEDFICVSRDEIIDYVTTSGTLGDPVTFVLTSEDLDRLGLQRISVIHHHRMQQTRRTATDDHYRQTFHGGSSLLYGSP